MNATLAAGNDLRLDLDESGSWHLGWTESDWLGPIGLVVQDAHGERRCRGVGHTPLVAGEDDLGSFLRTEALWDNPPRGICTRLRFYRDLSLIVFEITAEVDGTPSNGELARPCVAWPAFLPKQRRNGGVAPQTRTYGHQYTEFALPVVGDENLDGFFTAPHRPSIVEPLMFLTPDGRTVLLAPLNHFHEQVIAVPRDDNFEGVRCGWHGDLAEVPAGFSTELAVWAGTSPRQLLDDWAALLMRRHGTKRPSRYADDLVGKLSYWTDNGAVYYYRTEPGCDYTTTLEHVVIDLHANGIPIRELHLDSFFYPHQYLREVTPEGAPIVPPSGMRSWDPRPDLFPDGFKDLQSRLGGLPLSFHSRHFWSESPYWEHYDVWRDGDYAHPADNRLYDLLMAQAASWGAITYEQDWLIESFAGVRGLREKPGRARAWQEAMDRSAREHGLTLQWCMATPADFMQTVSLEAVTSIRTSGDYRYMLDNGVGWMWFLHGNALARAFGLNPFKDVFISHGKTSLHDGEPYAEVEALLAAMSAGPVGIGDQIGCSNREIILRCCREDGVLIKPDVPIAAVDRCFHGHAYFNETPLIGESFSQQPAGLWQYVASFNINHGKSSSAFHVALADLGRLQPTTDVIAFDWRKGTWERLPPNGGWDVSLDYQNWDYRILCPLLPGDLTVFGDVSKYATVGDRRVTDIRSVDGGVAFDAVGAPDTIVEVHGYAAKSPREVVAWSPAKKRLLASTPSAIGEVWSYDAERWIVRVAIGGEGRVRVEVC